MPVNSTLYVQFIVLAADMNVSMESCDDVIVRHLYDYKLDLLREEFDEENVRTVSSYQQVRNDIFFQVGILSMVKYFMCAN